MKRFASVLFLFPILTVCTIQAAAQTSISTEGVIESKSGGFKFPDGTIQTSAVEGMTNHSPTAIIHVMNQTGLTVTLSALGAFDPDDDLLSYEWNFGDGSFPENDLIELQHSYELPGTYVVVLKVNDPAGLIGIASVKLLIEEVNTPPIAVITPPEPNPGNCNTIVTFEGGASYDPEANPISYTWNFLDMPPGSYAQLNNKFVVNPSFTPDAPGYWVVRLVVNDGELNSSPVEASWECSFP